MVKKSSRKTKAVRIQNALDDLNKAMGLKEPHLVLYLPGGFFKTEESKEFVAAIKVFTEAYKKFYRLEKVEVDFIL